jgi:hypothetical protein
MGEIWRAKFILGTLFTTITVALSYEVKQNIIIAPPIVLVIISLIFSTILANYLVEFLFALKLGRKLIMRKTWIEGFWHLSTELTQNRNVLSQTGIILFSYEGDHHELTVRTYRKTTDKTDVGLYSLSELATVRSFDLSYSSIFKISDGINDRKGVAHGQFFSDGTSKYPNRYAGHIALFDEGQERRQFGTKITDQKIKKLVKQNKDWMNIFLKENPISQHTIFENCSQRNKIKNTSNDPKSSM